MATAQITYTSDLRTTARHILSGTTIITDAPLDNQGKGEAFSPTDLLATALGCCMLTIMGLAARDHGFSIDGTEVEITKVMISNPRRVGKVEILMTLPSNSFSIKQKRIIEAAARSCPVSLSVHPDIEQDLQFIYPA